MSDPLRYFESGAGVVAVTLPFDYEQAIKDWAALRRNMIRQVPDEFTRDEWAYLVSFLERDNLFEPFRQAFGKPLSETGAGPRYLYRPRGPIAVWLPNNVSLLGPLALVLLSLTGQRIRLKLGSSAQDLAGAFLHYAVSNLPEGPLREYLRDGVSAETFDRDDPRQQALSTESAVRVVFGSDEAAESIDRLPHPVNSLGFSFTDRRSEAWVEQDALDEQVLSSLIRVFSIYGQAGCTSPRRLVLLDGTPGGVREMRDRLLEMWPAVAGSETAMHTASANLMTGQWARALGWDAERTDKNTAVLALGRPGLEGFESTMALQILGAAPEQALADMPPNIQTIGHALKNPGDPAWLRLLAGSRVLRFVPLQLMHHFGSTWDGQEFWRQCFEVMEVQQ